MSKLRCCRYCQRWIPLNPDASGRSGTCAYFERVTQAYDVCGVGFLAVEMSQTRSRG